MPKLKGRKLAYGERWSKHIQYGAPALAGPAGDKLRQLRDEIRYEHRTRKKEKHDETSQF